MPRAARKYLETSFFHVMVQGINKEFIFKHERYINRYMQLIQKYLTQENIDIVAFCIMNNHAHLLVETNEIIELSKCMQKINSAYAKYYNKMEDDRVGYVFRDRYKSEPIKDKMHLIQCVKYIHQNPVKAGMVKKEGVYKYSSYNFYTDRQKLKNKIFTQEDIEYILNFEICEEEFIDIDIDPRKKLDNAINEFIKKENVKVFEIFEKNDILKELIKFLKNNKKIKYTDIMKKFDITKGQMEGLKR